MEREIVLEAMMPFLGERYGNASSLHARGREAARALAEAREEVAALIGADADEIVFTGSRCESNSLAIKGAAWASRAPVAVAVSERSHASTLAAAAQLADMGCAVERLRADEMGSVDRSELERALRGGAIVVSVMIDGSAESVEKASASARLCREHGALFHLDASEAAARGAVDVRDMGVDMMTISSAEIGGPRGAAALFVRRGVELAPIVRGGGQERGARNGTECVPFAVGFGAAASLVRPRARSPHFLK